MSGRKNKGKKNKGNAKFQSPEHFKSPKGNYRYSYSSDDNESTVRNFYLPLEEGSLRQVSGY